MKRPKAAKKRMKMKIVIRIMNESRKSSKISLRFTRIELKKRITTIGRSMLLMNGYSNVMALTTSSAMQMIIVTMKIQF